MSDPLDVKGLAAIQRALDTLPAKVEANIVRGGLRAAAKVIAEAAKQNAPLEDGDLRASIRVKTTLRGGKASATVVAGGKGGKGRKGVYYAHMVEGGTAAHVIRARSGKSLGNLGVSKVEHPGARKRPFLRPAMESGAPAAVAAMREYIRQRLARKHGLDVPAEPDDEA